ncbi:MAG TPA: GT4 family glycosyltransferase PelF [Solirubrobacteraceae bacterium]|nr:GT4 family glycosyltransferase PelF [Solirubrobacteraceae bacterium]
MATPQTAIGADGAPAQSRFVPDSSVAAARPAAVPPIPAPAVPALHAPATRTPALPAPDMPAPDTLAPARLRAVSAPLARGVRRPRILMTTEGTYPYAVGGVSSWCDLVIGGLPEFEWQILPIMAGDRRLSAIFELPPHAKLVGQIELWSERLPRRRLTVRPERRAKESLPAKLTRALIGWEGSYEDLLEALLWCRRRPDAVRTAFRGARAWETFIAALEEVLAEHHPDAGVAPKLDAVEAARLYQTVYWIARAAGIPTPKTDLLHVTAAGWAVIPALIHKRLYGTDMLLTEHGVYVREAYLAAARSPSSQGERFLSSRLARGLSRAAYTAADWVAPVTEANATWERGLGVAPEKIRVIQNGIEAPSSYTDPPGNLKIVSVGRIDPLKDVQTMLRVAVEVGRRVPGAKFEYWGPPTKGQETYARACEELARQLGAEQHFKFMGSTKDPNGVVRDADVMLMTSISEGLPMSILEAMAQARPVVATAVGGVPEVLRGCGIVQPPGDVHALATGVVTLLRNPQLARRLGQRGFERVHRVYTRTACVGGYRDLLGELTSAAMSA